MDYLKELVGGESMAQDRFFAFADAKLLREVKEAAAQGEFVPEMNPGILHPGATSSFKQVQFGEANVQLTFHENDTRTIGGVSCVKVELDIDYFKDAAAHALLEVVPGLIGGQRTDPAAVYVLRWIAGRFAGVPDFSSRAPTRSGCSTSGRSSTVTPRASLRASSTLPRTSKRCHFRAAVDAIQDTLGRTPRRAPR
jgi:hypothetical protein